MTQLVHFTEKTDTYVIGKDPDPDNYYIDPQHVSMVIPRVTRKNEHYTTLMVQGSWVVVDEDFATVVAKLGFST